MIHFNQAAGSFPKAPGVPEAMAAFLSLASGNIDRGAMATAGPDVVYETRKRLASLFGAAKAKNVVFASGVTAALNTLIFGALNPGDHVICTSLDHNAVLRPLHAARAHGIRHSVADADTAGYVDPNRIEALIRPETKAVIVPTASNVCGTYVPIKDIAALCRAKSLRLFVDTAQTAGSEAVRLDADGIDAICFTGHKGLLGPQGIGGLVLSDAIAATLRPLVFGGTGSQSQSADMPDRLPDRLEAGTLNLPGIAGLAAALAYLEETSIESLHRKKQTLTARFLRGLEGAAHVRVVGPADASRQSAVVSLDFPGRDNGLVAAALAADGILTRAGLHCAPLAHRSLGTFPHGTVRVSFGPFNTPDEIDRGIDAVLRVSASA